MPVTVELGNEDQTWAKVGVPPVPMMVRISNINFSKDRKDVYAYVENASDKPISINSAQLLEKNMAASGLDGTLASGRKRCLHFRLPAPLPFGERAYISVELANGERLGLSALAYGVFPVEGAKKPGLRGDCDGVSTKMILPHYSHFHYWQDVTAYRVMDALADPNGFGLGELPVAVVNQGYIKDAVVTLGELVPCFYLACEPIEAEYLGRYDEKDFHYLQAKVRYIKEATAPNPPWLGLRTFHGYGELRKELTPTEMRLRVAYLVSRGAKGIAYRSGFWNKCSEAWQASMRKEINAINRELILMRDLLRIAEPVDNVGKTSEPLVEAATLLAGDKGMVVYLLNHDRSFAWPVQEMDNKEPFWIAPKPDPIFVGVELPSGVKATEVYEVGGAWRVPAFETQNGGVAFTVDRLDAVRTFVVAFGQESGRARLFEKADEDLRLAMMLGKPGQDRKASRAPDIQFERKQVHFGEVDPLAGTVTCRFPFRNMGNAPLTVESVSTGVVEFSKATLDPGERGEATVVIRLDATPGKHKAEHAISTNDPNEPDIRLFTGGVVRPELSVSPRQAQLSAKRPTETIMLRDGREARLEIADISCDVPGVTWTVARDETWRTLSHSEVYRGKRLERTYQIQVSVSPEEAARGHRVGTLRVRTNAPHRPEVAVTVEVSPERRCQVSPPQLFFGQVKRGQTVCRTCKVLSEGNLAVESVEADAGDVRVTAGKTAGKHVIEAALTGGETGVRKGKIRLQVVLDGQRQVVVIPFFALVR